MPVEVESDPSPRRRTADTQQSPFGMPTPSGMKSTLNATESQPICRTANEENSINGTGRDDGFLAHRAWCLSKDWQATEDEQGNA
jgi:hypothetical protein